MKIKISIVLLILFSFFNIGAASSTNIKAYEFDKVKSVCMSESEFVESGVKLQYKTTTSLEDEKERVTNLFTKNNFSMEEELIFSRELIKVECNLWKDSFYTYVDVILTSKDKKYSSLELTNIIKKLININCEEVQFFYYYKGKTYEDSNVKYDRQINKISQVLNFDEVDILELNNGCTGNAYYNKMKINFATSIYDTGSYIIIGTPIIFTTY